MNCKKPMCYKCLTCYIKPKRYHNFRKVTFRCCLQKKIRNVNF